MCWYIPFSSFRNFLFFGGVERGKKCRIWHWWYGVMTELARASKQARKRSVIIFLYLLLCVHNTYVDCVCVCVCRLWEKIKKEHHNDSNAIYDREKMQVVCEPKAKKNWERRQKNVQVCAKSARVTHKEKEENPVQESEQASKRPYEREQTINDKYSSFLRNRYTHEFVVSKVTFMTRTGNHTQMMCIYLTECIWP